VEDESGTHSYSYDAWGNVVEMRYRRGGRDYVTRYSYDRENLLRSMTLPSGRVVEYSRDGVRRIEGVTTTVGGQRQSVVSQIRYRGDNRMVSCRFGNGLTDRRSYDLQGRLRSLRLGTETETTWRRNYNYDKNGNILGITGTAEPHSYSYDALDRLVTERQGQRSVQSYTYDLNNNRLSRSLSDTSEEELYTYIEGSNHLDTSDLLLRSNDGSSVQMKVTRYEYNDAGRLWKVYEAGELQIEYLYNSKNQRKVKLLYSEANLTGEIIYHYDMAGMLHGETNKEGHMLRDYIWVNGTPEAQIESQGTSEHIIYLHSDHLYTPRRATDHNSKVVWSWDSDAFGTKAPTEDPDGNGLLTIVNLRFPGQYYEDETSLNYNWNRYYDPQTSRYTTADPVGLKAGLNTFEYAYSNPIYYFDPDGLEATLTEAEELLKTANDVKNKVLSCLCKSHQGNMAECHDCCRSFHPARIVASSVGICEALCLPDIRPVYVILAGERIRLPEITRVDCNQLPQPLACLF